MITYCKKLTYGQCNVINLYISKCTSNIVNKLTTTTRRTSPSPFKGERVSTEIPGLLILGKMLFWRNIHFTVVMA